jgi:hypothetical protein
VSAKTAFLLYRSHLETDHQLLFGCREDLLRKVKSGWKVARRTIVLDANVLLDKNLQPLDLVSTGRSLRQTLAGSAPKPTSTKISRINGSGWVVLPCR